MIGWLAPACSAAAVFVGSTTGRVPIAKGHRSARARPPRWARAARVAAQPSLQEVAGSRALRLAALLCLLSVGALAVFAGALAAVGIGAVVGAALWTAGSARREHHARRRDQAWHEALARLAAGLQTGVALPEALRGAAAATRARGDAAATGAVRASPRKPRAHARHVVDTEGEPARRLRSAAAYLDLGGVPERAFDVGGHATDPMAARLSGCLGLCAALGVSPTSILAELAESELAREQSRRESRVALATARATSRLLAVLPLGGVLLAATFGVSAPRVLFATFGGQLCLCAAGLLEAIGLVWVQRLAAASAYP